MGDAVEEPAGGLLADALDQAAGESFWKFMLAPEVSAMDIYP